MSKQESVLSFLTSHTFDAIEDFHFKLLREVSQCSEIKLPCLEYRDGATHICFSPHFEILYESDTLDVSRKGLIVSYCGFVLQHITDGFPLKPIPSAARIKVFHQQLAQRGWVLDPDTFDVAAPALGVFVSSRPYIRDLIARHTPAVRELTFLIPLSPVS